MIEQQKNQSIYLLITYPSQGHLSLSVLPVCFGSNYSSFCMATSICCLLVKALAAEKKVLELFSVTVTCQFCAALLAKLHSREMRRCTNLPSLWELHKEKNLSGLW